MTNVKFKGVPVFMNGQEYLIPSLSLRQVEDNYSLLANANSSIQKSGEDNEETVDSIFKTYIPIILMAVQRNYPEVTEANLCEWVDLNNFAEILLLVQGKSGFKPQKSGEAPPVQ